MADRKEPNGHMLQSSIEGSIALNANRIECLDCWLVERLAMSCVASVFRRASIGRRHPLQVILIWREENLPRQAWHGGWKRQGIAGSAIE